VAGSSMLSMESRKGGDSVQTRVRLEPEAWQETPNGAALRASHCTVCRSYYFPPLRRCASCLSDVQTVTLSDEGILDSFTMIRVGRAGYKTPYALGYVDFPEGVRAFGQVRLGDTHPRLGARVRVGAASLRVDPDGSEVWSYCFDVLSATGVGRPLRETSSLQSLEHRPSSSVGVSIGPRSVVITGASMLPFGRYPERTVADLGQQVIVAALSDAGLRPTDIQAAWCGSVYAGMLTGQRILRDLGLSGIPIVNVENACSSGSTAIREAALAVGRGEIDTAIVVGVEQLSRFGGGTIPLDHDDWNVKQGAILPATYAMRAMRYLDRYGYGVEMLARVSVKNRMHAAANPYAQYRAEVSIEDVLRSRPIADPLTLLQCCPTGDGAAAVVISAADSVAARSASKPIRIIASSLFSGVLERGPTDLTQDEITIRTAADAYRQAGVGPSDIDVCELHDAFSIAELIYYEALGFCDRGEAPRLLVAGATTIGGRIPVNPSGGLLSRGHPLGATGVAQVVECVWQLRGQCGPRQVEGARTALCHCTGGGISGMDHGACTIHILATP
jgi:acetyl-CoA acetyltransferase/uncharacterized OB-fold protein